MIYTCPKCGKKMDLSTEVLINSEYKVICPQCLCELHIVGDYAYIPNDNLDLDTSVEPSRVINCPNCGHEANSNAHFCPNCGASFDASGADVPEPADVVIEGEGMPPLPPPLPDADPLFQAALQFLAQCTAITPMMLRDHFHISDERAAELIRQLEAAGAIGPYNNGGPRQILIPHREMYSYSVPPSALPQGGQGGPGQQQQPRSRFGCFTWVLVFLFMVCLMKACGA